MNCHCGEPLKFLREFGTLTTYVAYYSPPGHNHDDNCLTRFYQCKNGHTTIVSKRRRCPICDWVGKETCFCHPGKKVDEWPNDS